MQRGRCIVEKYNILLFLIFALAMQQTVCQNPAAEKRAYEEKQARLSNLIPVVFGDNLFASKKSWKELPQWEVFTNTEVPNYVAFLNNATLNGMVEQIKKSNKDLLYCIKLLRANIKLIDTTQSVFNEIRKTMQNIEQQLNSAQTTVISNQYRLNLLKAVAIALGSTANKAIKEARQKQLEEGWTEI